MERRCGVRKSEIKLKGFPQKLVHAADKDARFSISCITPACSFAGYTVRYVKTRTGPSETSTRLCTIESKLSRGYQLRRAHRTPFFDHFDRLAFVVFDIIEESILYKSDPVALSWPISQGPLTCNP